MKDLESARDLILRLQEIKRERRLSIPDIRKILESSGEYVSETTLRRVFAPGAHDADTFSYERTLRPIVGALLFQADPDDTAGLQVENDGLKALVRLKNEQLERIREQVTNLKADHEKRTAFLMDQIAKKDARMDRKDAIIQRLLDKLL